MASMNKAEEDLFFLDRWLKIASFHGIIWVGAVRFAGFAWNNFLIPYLINTLMDIYV